MERLYAEARYTYEFQNIVLVFLYILITTSHRRSDIRLSRSITHEAIRALGYLVNLETSP